MLEMKTLQTDAVTRIYEAHLTKDFAADELKPLSHILERIECGDYECFGFFESHQLVGYMFFSGSRKSNLLLLDYFAVVNGKRGMGYGSQMLRHVKSLEYNKDGIIIEIEHPDSAKSREDYEVRKKREAFYLNNGLEKTNVESRVNGVHFDILFFKKPDGQGTVHIANQLQLLYEDLLSNKYKYQIWMS